MPAPKQVVDDILGQHDYVFTIGGMGHTLDPHSIDAVVRVALYREENREWGINLLSRMLEGLLRRLNTEEGYPDYVEDSARIIEGLQTAIIPLTQVRNDLSSLRDAGKSSHARRPQENFPIQKPLIKKVSRPILCNPFS
jgi:hypothetical protein